MIYQKQLESAALAADIDAWVKAGGVVKELKHGETYSKNLISLVDKAPSYKREISAEKRKRQKDIKRVEMKNKRTQLQKSRELMLMEQASLLTQLVEKHGYEAIRDIAAKIGIAHKTIANAKNGVSAIGAKSWNKAICLLRVMGVAA